MAQANINNSLGVAMLQSVRRDRSKQLAAARN
jgi:hypothetical protein